jgi:hypothetical protein
VVGGALTLHSRVHVADGAFPGPRLEEFGRAVAALHGDVDVVLCGDVAVDGVDADVHGGHHSAFSRYRRWRR